MQLQVEDNLDAVGARPKLALPERARPDLIGDQLGDAGFGARIESRGSGSGWSVVRYTIEEIVADA
jgi:hypothetical protein